MESSTFLNKGRGFTILELSLSMLALGMLLLVTVPLIQDSFKEKKLQNDSNRVKVISRAATNYIKDNYSKIIVAATPTQPVMIMVSDLINSGYLESNTSHKNDYDQNICILVKERTPQGQLQGLLITEGGEAINDIDLAYYSNNIGAASGIITAAEPLEIKGVGGSWIMPTAAFDNLVNDRGKRCNGLAGNVRLTPGHAMMSLWFTPAKDHTRGLLARNRIPNRPELNQMVTPLDTNSPNNNIKMNGNDLKNVRFIGTEKMLITAENPSLDVNGIITSDILVAEEMFTSSNMLVHIEYAEVEALDGILQITNIHSANGGCTLRGSIAVTADGHLLNCAGTSLTDPNGTLKWNALVGGAGGVGLVDHCTPGVDASMPLGYFIEPLVVTATGADIAVTLLLACPSSIDEVEIEIVLTDTETNMEIGSQKIAYDLNMGGTVRLQDFGPLKCSQTSIDSGVCSDLVANERSLIYMIEDLICWGYECQFNFSKIGSPIILNNMLLQFKTKHKILWTNP